MDRRAVPFGSRMAQALGLSAVLVQSVVAFRCLQVTGGLYLAYLLSQDRDGRFPETGPTKARGSSIAKSGTPDRLTELHAAEARSSAIRRPGGLPVSQSKTTNKFGRRCF